MDQPGNPSSNHPVTFQDRVRTFTGNIMRSLGLAAHRAGIHPDTITMAGLIVTLLASVLIAQGLLQLAGVVLLLGLPLDALDGAVARAMGRKGRFGAVLDSSLDRIADGLIFGGLAYYFAARDQLDYMTLALASLIGSFVVSYVRARAGEAGLAVRIGLLDRLVRVIIILVSLIIPVLLVPALWVLAIGSSVTGAQRLWYVYKHLDREVQ